MPWRFDYSIGDHVNLRILSGLAGLALFLSVPLLSVSGCSSDDPCTENSYSCNGNVLQKCQDGALVDVEDCGAKTCMASMGHCHDDEHGHGGGGSHMGGSHMGGSHMGGSHMGGSHMGGSHMGGSGGN